MVWFCGILGGGEIQQSGSGQQGQLRTVALGPMAVAVKETDLCFVTFESHVTEHWDGIEMKKQDYQI